MSSCSSNSLAPWWRSQSQIRRWISGSDTRRRSGRGGKSPAGTAPPGLLRALVVLLPDQETVGQQHHHRVAVEPRPQPPLILVPAQQSLGLLVILLYPVPTMRVPPHLLQRGLRPQVAPVVPSLAIGTVLPDQPARRLPSGRTRQPRTATNGACSQPLLPSGQRTVRHARAGGVATTASARCSATLGRRLKATWKSPRTAAT
jgi:hypothetical protein